MMQVVGPKRATCAEEIARNPQRFVGMDMTDIYETLKADNARGLRRAQNRGTNVHTYFEMGLRGHPSRAMEAKSDDRGTGWHNIVIELELNGT